MSRFIFTSALGDNLSPFAPKKEYEVATAIGIGLGAASLLGSAYSAYKNLKSQADTNETNYKIHQEQLAAQRQMHEQDIAQARYNADVAYERSLPKNVVKNLKEAGINPAYAYDSGSFGSAQAQQASVPSAPSMPNAPQQQALDYSGFGVGINQAANIIGNAYIADKEQDRADYALANQITVSRVQAKAEMMNAFTKAKEAGVNEAWLKKQYEEMDRNYWLQVDKNASEKEDRAIQRDIEMRTNEIRQYEAETQRIVANAGVHLSKAQINRLAQEVVESKEKVTQMVKDGESRRAIEAFIHDKEMYLTNILGREWRITSDRDSEGLDKWESVVGGLLSPVKGIVSIGIR